MFYFGGMTLGYLEKAPSDRLGQKGEKKAAAAPGTEAAETVPARSALLSRANWFNLYW